MSDPVAEAAAQLAALQSQAPVETPPVEVPNVPAVAEASATAPAIAEGAGGAAVGESQQSSPVSTTSITPGPSWAAELPKATEQSIPAEAAAAPTSSVASDALQPAVELPNAAASTSPAGAAIDAAGDSGNVAGVAGGGALATGAVVADGGDLPNAASVAVEPTTALGSASNAAGESITSTTGASFVEPPLHIRIAEHLEAIYQLAFNHSIATETAATRAAATTKTHIGDILHRISNGMAVTEGELVTKLEALYRML